MLRGRAHAGGTMSCTACSQNLRRSSIDPVSRKYGAAWNYSDGESAKYASEKICVQKSNSNRCISHWASYYYTAVAISSDDRNCLVIDVPSISDEKRKMLERIANNIRLFN